MDSSEARRRFPVASEPAELHGYQFRLGMLAVDIDTMPDSREKSLVLTHLETAGMWLAKCYDHE